MDSSSTALKAEAIEKSVNIYTAGLIDGYQKRFPPDSADLGVGS